MHPVVAFGLMLATQAAVLLFVAYATNNLRDLRSRRMVYALALGLVGGVLGDEILGAYFGVFSYSLGFNPAFLVLNGLFSYGMWMATVILIRKLRIVRFVAWALLIALLYELADSALPVWHWSFLSESHLEQETVVLLCYLALTLFTAFTFDTLGVATFAIFHRRR